jgi:hypothetical protein
MAKIASHNARKIKENVNHSNTLKSLPMFFMVSENKR